MRGIFYRIFLITASISIMASMPVTAKTQDGMNTLGGFTEQECWNENDRSSLVEEVLYPLKDYVDQAGLQFFDAVLGFDQMGDPVMERRPRQDEDYGLYNYFGLSDELCRSLYGQGGQIGTGEWAYAGDSLLTLAGTPLYQDDSGDKTYRWQRDQVAKAIRQYLNNVSWQEMSETERARHAALYIASNCTYDTGLYKRFLTGQNTNGDPSFTAYGCLVNHRAVCEGISVSYQLLARAMGLKCFCGPDDTDENHMFNYVQADGNWYRVDLAVVGQTPEIMVGECFSSTYNNKVEQIFRAYYKQDHEELGPGEVRELTGMEHFRVYQQ